ncbi:hypothetical protein SASPL_156254 [Salvia splendens]|uniref:Uncharacterized protein n=1 Tax=Salvia splendens TaxID=180675 RepID=A0A8X8VX01_SALSN|nr:hypothetical protein SASPL_156254 [Salvia splendens]
MATFKSVFDNYVVSDRVHDAITIMGKTQPAENYFRIVKERVRVDAEREREVGRAQVLMECEKRWKDFSAMTERGCYPGMKFSSLP